MNTLLNALLPALIARYGLGHLPRCAEEARNIVRNALGGAEFKTLTLQICKNCHYPRGTRLKTEHCKHCSTSKTLVCNWGEMKVAHRPLAGCIQWLIKDPTFALAMLDHLAEGSTLPQHCSLNSERYRFYRKLLSEISPDPRNLILALHHDGFCPFENDKDQKSIGYLLVRAMIDPRKANHQSFVRVWLCNDGHVKSFEAMLPLLRKDLIECFQEGVV